MDGPCQVPSSAPLWVFLVLGFLAHARGAALLLREVALWAAKRRRHSRRSKTPRL